MDKTSIVNIKNDENHLVHEVPVEMPDFHFAYGLWIFSYHRNSPSGKRLKLKPRHFEFYGLSHTIKGNGWYWSSEQKKETVETGQCIISTPDFIQDYAGLDKDYTEDSICFSGSIADHLCRCGIIKNGIFPMGKDRRLLQIFKLASDPSHDSQIHANFALQKLLLDIYFNSKAADKQNKHSQIDYLIEQILSNPKRWWTSVEMSDICNLSESQFRIIFKQKTGMNPKTYIDRLKIQKASEQLCNSDNSIAAIAEDLGYMNPYHFSKRFKQLTSLAPEHYRKQYLLK